MHPRYPALGGLLFVAACGTMPTPPQAAVVSVPLVRATPIMTERPIFPPNLLKTGAEGSVTIDCTIERDGSTADCFVIVLNGDGGFIPPALQVAKTAKFKPATRNDLPVRQEHYTLLIQFTRGAQNQ